MTLKRTPRLAGVELGGTKTIAVLAEADRIIDTVTIPTLDPGKTLPPIRSLLAQWHREGELAGIGIASFGPIELRQPHDRFGTLLTTPKPGWSGADLVTGLLCEVAAPFRIDTDVNGAALAEYQQGAGKGCSVLCYVTVGTGVGGGILVNGHPVHGAMHPEIGHLRLRRRHGDGFGGTCPFHGDCIEGLVSGPALAMRFGVEPASVADDDPRWENIAFDLAQMCGAILAATSAERILFGGSVSNHRPFLLPMVRRQLVEDGGRYFPFLTSATAEQIIAPAGLGDRAGPAGAIALARLAFEQKQSAAG